MTPAWIVEQTAAVNAEVAAGLERLHRALVVALGHDVDRRVVAITSSMWATGDFGTAADRFRRLADDLDHLQRQVDLARGVPSEPPLHLVRGAA